jgi:hypothetical protein
MLPSGYAIAVGPALPPRAAFAAWLADREPGKWKLVLDLYLPWRPPRATTNPSDSPPLNWAEPEEFAREFKALEEKGKLDDDDLQRLRGLLCVPDPKQPFERRGRRAARVLREVACRAGFEGMPRSQVPLVRDNAQLRAALALRCAQQGYRAEEAMQELRRYGRQRGIKEYTPWGDRVLDDVLSQTLMNVEELRPHGLPKYLRKVAKATLARLAEQRTLPGELLTAIEAASELSVSRRTIYNWSEQGVLNPAGTNPLMFRWADVVRCRDRRATRLGLIYRLVMERRGVGYHTARAWAKRRLERGMSSKAILEEADELGAGGAEKKPGDKARHQSSEKADSGALAKVLGFDPFSEIGR